MATILDSIKRARRLINSLGVGETLEAELASDGLEAANAMLESWSLDGLIIYTIQSNTFTLTSAQTYTIGSGGAFNMARPDRIESAYFSAGGLDYPLTIIDTEQWNDINVKNVSSIPSCLKYDPATPLGLISIYPTGTGTLTINSFSPLQTFSSLTDVLAYPRGYKRAIDFCLAVEIASETGKSVPPDVLRVAISAKAAIKKINTEIPVLKIDPFFTGGRWSGNALRGYYS